MHGQGGGMGSTLSHSGRLEEVRGGDATMPEIEKKVVVVVMGAFHSEQSAETRWGIGRNSLGTCGDVVPSVKNSPETKIGRRR